MIADVVRSWIHNVTVPDLIHNSIFGNMGLEMSFGLVYPQFNFCYTGLEMSFWPCRYTIQFH
jgi:hypothetical protein